MIFNDQSAKDSRRLFLPRFQIGLLTDKILSLHLRPGEARLDRVILRSELVSIESVSLFQATRGCIDPDSHCRNALLVAISPSSMGSSRSDVFHRPGCPGAQKILPHNLVRFPSRKAALASGRRPAADCHP